MGVKASGAGNERSPMVFSRSTFSPDGCLLPGRNLARVQARKAGTLLLVEGRRGKAEEDDGEEDGRRRLLQSWLVMQKIRFSSAFDGSAHQHLRKVAGRVTHKLRWSCGTATAEKAPTGGEGGGLSLTRWVRKRRGLVELSRVTTTAPIALTAMSEALRLPGPACLPGGGPALLTIKQTDRFHLYSQVSRRGINSPALRRRINGGHHRSHPRSPHHHQRRWRSRVRWEGNGRLRRGATSMLPMLMRRH